MDAHPNIPVRPGDVIAEKYRVERILGVGGMGFVVAARNIHLSKAVALKMMLPEALAHPKAVERFEREARAAVQLKSEHVAEVLDIGKLDNGAPYIVMELLEGTDFEGVLDRDRGLNAEDAIEYVLQACEAIAEAHGVGVVHRDLKPRNLFLAHRLDGTPVVKVLDFGISKWTLANADNHELTRTTDVIGSPNYMSPEQIRSAKDVDARTDIWSLGVVLFELLTGRVPFVAESLPALCALVLEQPAPLVSSLRPDVHPGVSAVVARCLEKSRDHRFASIAELVEALRPFAPASGRRSGEARSPVASTLHMGGPSPSGVRSGSGPLAPQVPSNASGPLTGSQAATGVSFSGTMFEGMRRRPGMIGIVLVAGGALFSVSILAIFWLGVGRSVLGRGAPTDAAAGIASPTDAASAQALGSSPVPPLPFPSLVPSASAAPPAPSASASASSTGTLPTYVPRVVPPTRDAGAPETVRPPSSAKPPPSSTNNPFTPVDRK